MDGGLVFKARRLLHHSILGSRLIKKKKEGFRACLEGLELEALVLLGEVVEEELGQLVGRVVHVRASARRRDRVHERHLQVYRLSVYVSE